MLNNRQITYVLYHLNLQYVLTEEIKDLFIFESFSTPRKAEQQGIFFPLWDQGLDTHNIFYIRTKPVLYSFFERAEVYKYQDDFLEYNHDFISSAFYLLSAYQETNSARLDKYGRFPFSESVQAKLEVSRLPLVNYYFDFIAEGIAAYCSKKGIRFEKRSVLPKMAFLLTHDVDVIDTYTFHDLVFKTKQLFGLAKSKYGFRKRLEFFIKYTVSYLSLFNRKNSHWDFDYLLGEAKKREFKSVFFFLNKDVKHQDSYYEFGEERMLSLFKELVANGAEIGLHGSTGSVDSQHILNSHLASLKENSNYDVKGIRQHRLIHKQVKTARMQEKAGFLYDASLGFAEAIGFRNSFCLPFKLYDHEKDEMIDLWHIPLNVMDATLYMYSGDGVNLNEIEELIAECKRFGGVFSLLWHNGNFDQENYPEGKRVFEGILDRVKSLDVISVSGRELIYKYFLPALELENSNK